MGYGDDLDQILIQTPQQPDIAGVAKAQGKQPVIWR